MARVPSKHGRDQTLDFEGFLNNLQDWELSVKDKDKKLKAQAHGKEKLVSSSDNIGLSENRRSTGKNSSLDCSKRTAGQYEYSRSYDSMANIPSSFKNEENSPDAASEKELGNEFFKQKKFKEAVDCYSKSIVLSPTAVAYANRAMAFLKMRKFQEAEDDCTEALYLDDRYVKAYSRRATARKELGKLKESIEDSEFALRLEPLNKEIKKQHAETKSLYGKEIIQKASGALKESVHGASVSSDSHRATTVATSLDNKEQGGQFPVKTSKSVVELESKKLEVENSDVVRVNGPREKAVRASGLRNNRTNHKELEASMQQLVSRAASRAMTEAAKNITPPNSAYQFEVSWRALSGDFTLQARLLKAVPPSALPQIFKNALSAPILIGIVKCVASFFNEETDLAVNYLDNLTKVARFDMIMMCLSSTDRAGILEIWDEVFCGKATPAEFADILGQLRSKYCT